MNPQVSPKVSRYIQTRPLRTIYHLYDGDRRRLLLAVVFFVIKASPVWIISIIVRNVINTLSAPDAHTIRTLWINVGVMAVLYVQNIPTHLIFMRLLSVANRNMEVRLRGTLVGRLQALSISFHDDFRAGKLHSKMLRDVESLQMLTELFFNVLLQGAIGIGVVIAVTLSNEPRVALFYMVTVPIGAGLIQLFRRRIRTRSRAFRNELEMMSARVADMLEMIPVTRAHGLENIEIQRMHTHLKKVRRQGISLDVMNALFGSSAWVAFNVFSLACLIVTAYMSLHGRIKIGDVVLYSSFFQMLLGSVGMILNSYPQIVRGFDAIRSIGEVLVSEDLEPNDGKRVVTQIQGGFTFDHVDFSYNGSGGPAVKDLCVEVRPEECIAVVGESGSGKSTIMNLIIGFRRPTGGRILLDGVDMEALDLRTYRRHLAVVSQHTVLFSGSIRENITYGLDDVGEEALRRAIAMANARDFIEALPDGLETLIGEHGGKLSGGQRQRLAIARALVRDPRVIIFDEATSSLDVASERLVQEAMERLIKGRTTFIVAHRLSTIRDANRIMVMHQARLVEIGTYQELLARQGEFYRLVKLQI